MHPDPTLPGLFLSAHDADPARVLTHHPRPAPGGGWAWEPHTMTQAAEEIAGLARRLYALGVQRGVPVAIVAQTSPAWTAADLAILALAGITVGIYPTLTGEQTAWQLRHSRAKILLVEDEIQHRKLAPYLDDLEDLDHVLSLQPADSCPQLHAAQPDLEFLRARAAEVRPDDVASYVYTSGTTANPKAVVLTHRNFGANILASREAMPLHRGERTVLYLPLAHSLQRFALYRGLLEHGEGWYAPALDQLAPTLLAARPTVLPVVPRVLEKIRAAAHAAAAARGPTAERALGWAIAVGGTIHRHRRAGTKPPLRLLAQRALAERLVYRRIRERLGGSVRLIVCGGAALSPAVAEWFEAVGVPVREGWGLTETTAPATLAREAEIPDPGTVGAPLPGVEVALAPDGELLVRGPGVFQGYLRDPESNAAVFTPDGFFRTGDLGRIDERGQVFLTGRKKEILVTAAGKNVPPAPLEQKLAGDLLGQAVVVGDGRPYLAALVAPDEETLAALARERGWPGGYAEWSAQPEVRQRIEDRIAAVNATLAPFETIKRFAVLPSPPSIEGGELTATLKLRRPAIAAKYAALIEALYA